MGRLSLKPLFLIIASAHLIFPTTSQPDFLFSTCSNNSNYTRNSTFSKNINNVLLSISSNTRFNNYSFYNATSGQDPERATALALCRGGVPLEQCRSCVYNSTLRITQDCPNQKEAAGWYQDCQIRYSNNSIYGVEDSSPLIFFWNFQTAEDPVGFNDALWNLLDRLRKEAALGSSILKSAWGGEKIRSPIIDTVYGLVDCYPDLSYLDCFDCLRNLQSIIPSCCNASIGVRVIATSCQLNYELHPIYPLPSSPPPPPYSPPPPPSPPLPPFLHFTCSNKSGNYTNNTTFKKNLDTVLLSISSKTSYIDYGYYNETSGQDPDRATALALCRGGVELEQCRRCVYNSTLRITQDCPNQKEAEGLYQDCQIRYSNNSIYGVKDNSVQLFLFNLGRVEDWVGFNMALRSLFDRLKMEASSGSSIQKSAWGGEKVRSPSMDTIYGLVDCFPDLSYLDCFDCLNQLQASLPSCCNASIGVRLAATSCQLAYELHPVYAPLPPPPSPLPLPRWPPTSPPSPSPSHENNYDNSGRSRTIVIIMVTIVSAAVILLVAIFIILMLRKKKRKRPSDNFQDISVGDTGNEIISSVEMIQFDFDSIKVATNDFASENKLGQGGFGVVYKGKLPDGRAIAVKRLANNSQQGDVEFKNEVLLMLKLQHRNLVRLLGFCLQGSSERLLIYEFIQNGSLDHFIFDFAKRALLDWETRFKIINSIARGLVYLHEDSQHRIIHRDLKASNILLDEDMNSKISDFGMARLFEVDQTQGNTNRVVGTYGYMAPEYIIHGRFSVKSDVYSFGILVLEILSGKKNNSFHNEELTEDLSSFAWTNWMGGTISNVIDSTLTVGSRIEMIRCIHIGLLCVQENVTNRPTMATVVMMLSTSSLTLPMPSKPAFFLHSSTNRYNDTTLRPGGANCENASVQLSKNNISITEVHPR